MEEEEKEDKFVSLQTHAARDLNILNWLLRNNNSINKNSHSQPQGVTTLPLAFTFLSFISLIFFSLIISNRSNVSSKESGFCFFVSGTGLSTITWRTQNYY